MKSLLSRRIFVASLVVMISASIFSAGYFQENSETYLFPMIIGVLMLILSALSLSREVFELCLEDYQQFPFRRQLPVILIMILGVSTLELLGMFSTTFLVLITVSYWYSPVEDKKKRLVRSIMFSGGFTFAMYLLFSVMLNVQLPRGWIF